MNESKMLRLREWEALNPEKAKESRKNRHKPAKDLKKARTRLDRAEGTYRGKLPPSKKKKARHITYQRAKNMPGGMANKRRIEDARVVTVQLYLRHSANGTSYGPGPTTGPASVVMPFYYAEQKLARSEMKLMQPRSAILTWGRGGPKLLRVAPQRLDGLLMQEYGMATQEKL